MKRPAFDRRNYDGWTVADFTHDLETNERYQNFFKNYKSRDVEQFIKEYASHKAELYEKRNELESSLEFSQIEYLLDAEKFINVILQKKLFNLQCLWIAGNIDLPFIEYSGDFGYFESNIRQCPFIEPITEEELALGIRYLQEEDDETDPHDTNWQEYCRFKAWDLAADEDDDDDADELLEKIDYSIYCEEEMPQFYNYYDTHFKTGYLFNLPPNRLYREHAYLMAVREKNHREYIEASKDKPADPEKDLQYLHYYYQKDVFVENTEDPITKKLNNAKYVFRSSKFDFDEPCNNYIDFLLRLRKSGETIAFEPHEDWHESLRLTVARTKQRKIAEMLPYAYQTYLLEFQEDDWEIEKARRIARFQFDEKNIGYHYLKSERECMENGKALLGL
jgi:hypothetical protein